MSNYLRSLIFEKVIRPIQNIDSLHQHKILSQLHVALNRKKDIYSFMLPLKSNDYDVTNAIGDITKNNLDDVFDNVTVGNDTVSFNMLRDRYVKTILESNHSGLVPPLLVDNNRNVIVEFSSPNIAKPFHLGHLRSTIIGNYVANINNYLRNKVKKINYVGDWGTQFGFIQLGIEVANISNDEMHRNPIKALYKAYVAANKLAKTDPTISERARETFRRLEFGDSTIYNQWQTFKEYTVQELETTYKRIGIIFDEYHWESMYTAKSTNQIIQLMEEMQLLTLDDKDRKAVAISEDRNIPIIKSDGSTLYMTRDIAAAIDRFEKNRFDAMYYVVDNAQSDHFSSLIKILNKMELPWANRLEHIKYGRVRGMSTRQGTAVFLEDILNEAREVMKERQICTSTTKVSLDELDNSSDILGISGVIIHDLKQKRTKDYEFNWDLITDMKGNTGIKLQYTHCRLTNLELHCGATLTTECNPSLLKEPVVDDLIILISKFDEVVLKSYERLEPCILTIYLFRLSDAVNKAMKSLRIKDEPSDLASQRLMLFHTSKIIFAQSMKLLGLTPMERM
ncbi:arginyl-tRNA synthetase, mitochondrial isoform X2 [Andrena cerasifolii]|uniref:arginyl-tRNA synthetase, mitochondrial isoform X2 n=1 Tax=Andrena cerasifolii TaxID=2819439 RepID=UPI0040384B75